MRKLCVLEYVTLDGVMEAPERWQFPYLSDDVQDEIRTNLDAMAALLLGRVTYEIFAAHWPLRTHNEFGVADKMNSVPKFVVSTTLERAAWNNSTLLRGNVLDEITALKQQIGGTIGVIGSAALARSLMQADLIDEYQLLVHPVTDDHRMHQKLILVDQISLHQRPGERRAADCRRPEIRRCKSI